ncbi:response regulator [Desulfotalea psychrophila]|uniref:Probable two-component system response regulator (Hybrid family) n=1 Tax=Desulfotalea psychrophila (strain LSv54 / DSM 12343) TaxID=177439 RepID=Q6APW0_DESPS|nr:HD domain-containing phosphohydrolase [Desulfotalea psychrophila]CAG35613.1 probable two-component system response regulator (hybrid family) [Desulfotalea psychrophila LSv54]
MEKYRILLVDDEPNNLKLLREILGGVYDLKFATNGKNALLAAEKHQPHLILLDVMMPGMDGYEVCRRLKADPLTAKIPVIFATARTKVEDEKHGFDVGGVDYLTKPLSAPIVLRRVATHLSLVRVDELDSLARAAIRMLGEAGHYNDTDTGEHIWQMAAYSRAIAVAAGWSIERANKIELAAPMHDMGKVGIPDNILKAPRKLEPEEWQVIMTHCQIGYDILVMSDNPIFQLAAEIALGHHEKWDGTGYPLQRSGEDIPESARIVAIADIFDALTMKRPYKEAWSVEDAFLEIEQLSGSQLEPRLVERFLSIEEEIRAIKIKWDGV